MPVRYTIVAALAALVAATPATAQDKIKVIATFSILADLVKNVGGDRVEVASLVGPNSDAHVYSPTPADAKKVADAKVVFTNGLGFEGWIDPPDQGFGFQGARHRRHQGRHAAQDRERPWPQPCHGHGGTDPHAWQSVANVKIYVANIRDCADRRRPGGQGDLRGERHGLSRPSSMRWKRK